MAVMENTVSQMYDICELKGIITDVRINLLEAIKKLLDINKTNGTETITFDMTELSEEELNFLNTYHMMIDDQNEFTRDIANINYESIVLNDEEDSYGTY